MNCYACHLKSHNIENCPHLLFLPDKLFHIQRYLHSDPVLMRQPCRRRSKRSNNPRDNLTLLKQETIRFSLTLGPIDENSDYMVENNSEEEKESQNSLSLSLIFESQTQKEDEERLLKNDEFRGGEADTYATFGFNRRYNSAANIKEEVRQDDQGFRREESQSQQQYFKINGRQMEELKLQLNDGELSNPNPPLNFNIANNPNFLCHNSYLSKGKKEESWREGMESTGKRDKKKKTRKEEEGEKRVRRISTASGPKKEPSDKSYSMEGMEFVKKMSSNVFFDKQPTTIIREDFMFRFLKFLCRFRLHKESYKILQNIIFYKHILKFPNKNHYFFLGSLKKCILLSNIFLNIMLKMSSIIIVKLKRKKIKPSKRDF